MIKTFRKVAALAAVGVAFVAGLSGCSSQPGDDEAEIGSITLPLAADAQSGAHYRLRNATFEIWGSYYWYDGAGGSASTGTSGGGFGSLVTVNSEDEDPDASSIVVDLEQGPYNVALLPGWNFEKVEGATVTNVEATLLSSETVYVYVSPHSTTWAQYQFGIGDSDLWLNGKLNLNINVYEDPNEYYGVGGAGGGYQSSVSSTGVGGYGSSVGVGGAGGYGSSVGVGGAGGF